MTADDGSLAESFRKKIRKTGETDTARIDEYAERHLRLHFLSRALSLAIREHEMGERMARDFLRPNARRGQLARFWRGQMATWDQSGEEEATFQDNFPILAGILAYGGNEGPAERVLQGMPALLLNRLGMAFDRAAISNRLTDAIDLGIPIPRRATDAVIACANETRKDTKRLIWDMAQALEREGVRERDNAFARLYRHYEQLTWVTRTDAFLGAQSRISRRLIDQILEANLLRATYVPRAIQSEIHVERDAVARFGIDTSLFYDAFINRTAEMYPR